MASRSTGERRPRGTRTLQELLSRRAFSGISKTRLRQVLAPAETGERWKATGRSSHSALYDAELVDLIARTLGSGDGAAPTAAKPTGRRKAPPLRKGEKWFTTTDLQRIALAEYGVGLESWHIRSQLDRHALRVLPRYDFGDGLGTKYASARASSCLRHARPRSRNPYGPYLTSRIRQARTQLMQSLTELQLDRELKDRLASAFDRAVQQATLPVGGAWDGQAPAATAERIDQLVDRSLKDFSKRVKAAAKKKNFDELLPPAAVDVALAPPVGPEKKKPKRRTSAKISKLARQAQQLAEGLAPEVDAAPGPLLEAIATYMLEREVWVHGEIVGAPAAAAKQLQDWFGDIAEGADGRKPPHAALIDALLTTLLPDVPLDAQSHDELRRFVIKEVRTRVWTFDCLWHGLSVERRSVERFIARDLPTIHAGRILNQLTVPADAKLSPHEAGMVVERMRERLRQRLQAGGGIPDVATMQDEFDQLSRKSSSNLKRREARRRS